MRDVCDQMNAVVCSGLSCRDSQLSTAFAAAAHSRLSKSRAVVAASDPAARSCPHSLSRRACQVSDPSDPTSPFVFHYSSPSARAQSSPSHAAAAQAARADGEDARSLFLRRPVSLGRVLTRRTYSEPQSPARTCASLTTRAQKAGHDPHATMQEAIGDTMGAERGPKRC